MRLLHAGRRPVGSEIHCLRRAASGITIFAMRRKVICLENMPFQSPIRVGSHHYAERFSRHFDVLWISLPWHIFQLVKRADNKRYAHFNRGRPVPINDHLQALVPFVTWPYRRGRLFDAGWIVDRYYQMMWPRIGHVLRTYGFEEPDLLWFSDPRHLSILRHVRGRKIAYRCVDNLEHFPDVPAGLIDREVELVRRSDVVFCTARPLLDKFSPYNGRTVLLPNGVDYEFFAEAQGDDALPAMVHRALARRRERNIVYMGAVAEWFDFAALEHLAGALPEHRIVVVGPLRVRPPDSLRRRENVCFAGPVPYEVLPGLLRRCRVGLVPFVIDEITDFVSPIKLFEYFAGGLEVVCSGMRTARALNSPAWIYEPGRIVDATKRALAAADGPGRAEQVRAYARENSWSQRFATILEQVGMT